jgi:molybdopterin-guanine dinucleotide biosynthesis protein A
VNKITKNEITAVILAGGQALRMNGEDKGLIVFRELP